jgi:hypothetical protein
MVGSLPAGRQTLRLWRMVSHHGRRKKEAPADPGISPSVTCALLLGSLLIQTISSPKAERGSAKPRKGGHCYWIPRLVPTYPLDAFHTVVNGGALR